jgi:hypothetical protein
LVWQAAQPTVMHSSDERDVLDRELHALDENFGKAAQRIFLDRPKILTDKSEFAHGAAP